MKNVKNKIKNIQAQRLATLEKALKDKKLEMILVCSSLQEYSFGFALNSIKPIIYHYFFLKKGARVGHGFFVPYFLTERLGLSKKNNVVEFDDKDVSGAMAKLLKGVKRVGILGPAPAAHFSHSKAELVFLDDEMWPILVKKTAREIEKIRGVGWMLGQVLEGVTGEMRAGVRLDKIAEHLDKEILQVADDLAFPSLVESRHGQHHILSLLGFKARLKVKDMVFINVGAQKDGLFADAGRTFFVNNAALSKRYLQMDKAFVAFTKTLKPGLKLVDLAGMLKKQLAKAGLKNAELRDEYLGHGIGFSIISLPFIGRNLFPKAQLEADSVWSLVVEVKVGGEYLKLQDTVLVKARGGAEILTR